MGRVFRSPRWQLCLAIACCVHLASGAAPVVYLWTDGHREAHLLGQTSARLCADGPLLPPAWLSPIVKVRLRLSLPAEDRDIKEWPTQPVNLERKYPLRPYCQLLGPTPSWLCEDCQSEPCPSVALEPVWGSYDRFTELPPEGGCVYIHELPNGMQTIDAEWEQYTDPLVFVKFALGLYLLWSWQELCESTAVHATIGCVGSLGLIVTTVLLWVMREVRGHIHGSIPFGRTLTSISMFLFAFIPALRDAVRTRLVPSGKNWSGWWDFMWDFREPFFDIQIFPILLGLSAMTAIGGGSFGAHLGMKFFASDPFPIGEIPFTIGRDGRRIDILPPAPLPQWLLGWFFWSWGFLSLVLSTHVDQVSAFITSLALWQGLLLHAVGRWMMSRSTKFLPQHLRPLMSRNAFEMQGRTCTADAVEQLRCQLQMSPHLVRCVREESELRVRRFSDGGLHCPQPADLFDEPRTRWLSCCVL